MKKKLVIFAALGVDATRLYSRAKTEKFSDFLPKIGVQLQLGTCFRPSETDLLKLSKAGCTHISARDGLGNVRDRLLRPWGGGGGGGGGFCGGGIKTLEYAFLFGGGEFLSSWLNGGGGGQFFIPLHTLMQYCHCISSY